jgi:cephalosporin-C deacetylase-like acetyl esterase
MAGENINAHDLPIDKPASFYEEQTQGALKEYWKMGNDDREKSYFLRMYLACYRAAEYLTERPDWDGKTFLVIGTSQGGLQALLTAAFQSKVTAVIAGVPGGCDLTREKLGSRDGWPAWTFRTAGEENVRTTEASRYYDIANFTPRIKCPVLVSAGLIDEICPPEGIVGAVNQIKGPKELVLLPRADHMGTDDTHRRFAERSKVWQAALLEGRAAPVLQEANGR